MFYVKRLGPRHGEKAVWYGVYSATPTGTALITEVSEPRRDAQRLADLLNAALATYLGDAVVPVPGLVEDLRPGDGLRYSGDGAEERAQLEEMLRG